MLTTTPYRIELSELNTIYKPFAFACILPNHICILHRLVQIKYQGYLITILVSAQQPCSPLNYRSGLVFITALEDSFGFDGPSLSRLPSEKLTKEVKDESLKRK
jgi:hypothetical protein